MSSNVIQVNSLGKQYNIGALHRKNQHDTLRDAITANFKSAGKHLLHRKATIFGTEKFWALRDISFEVKKGEVLGIIGKNGAGKSTLLKILCKVTSPTEGVAVLHGKVGTLLEVGTGFNAELTGRDNIFLSGAILGMKKSYIDAKFDEIVTFSGIEKFIDTPVKRYSSGMLVRLGFAVASHLQPEILLIDEVLAVGDATFRKKCLGKMHDVASAGRTILFVSHNMKAITSLCTRAIRLSSGQIVDEGDPYQVVKKYLDSGEISENSHEWEPNTAPGNEFVSLLRVCVNTNDKSDAEITMSDSFTITVNYENRKRDKHLAVSLHLFNEQGDLVFNPSNGTDDLPTQGMSRGEYSTSFSFPGDLLNSGRYIVTLLFVEKGGIQRLWVKEVLQFEIVDRRIRDIDEWFGRNPGLIVPSIPTETERISDYLGR